MNEIESCEYIISRGGDCLGEGCKGVACFYSPRAAQEVSNSFSTICMITFAFLGFPQRVMSYSHRNDYVPAKLAFAQGKVRKAKCQKLRELIKK